jgi:hypothetical protein
MDKIEELVDTSQAGCVPMWCTSGWWRSGSTGPTARRAG